MVGHGAKFGRKKEEAIAALLSQRSIEDAARVANIGTNTLLRWLQLPELGDDSVLWGALALASGVRSKAS